MPAITCLTGPPFSLFADAVNKRFVFEFDNQEDQELVKVYEWYINGLLVVDQRAATLNVQLTPGYFIIGGRILMQSGWSGIKECEVNVWANVEHYAVFFKNDCGNNYSGTTVPYSVYPYQFFSFISQEDADQQAISYLNTRGQQYANEAGSCVLTTLNCGSGTSYAQTDTFPSTYKINFPPVTGLVTFEFTSFTIPDKFVVEFDGNIVIDTGYVGSTGKQSDLDAFLLSKGLPSEAIVEGSGGTRTFLKSSPATVGYVKIYGPLQDTNWNFTISCPQNG